MPKKFIKVKLGVKKGGNIINYDAFDQFQRIRKRNFTNRITKPYEAYKPHFTIPFLTQLNNTIAAAKRNKRGARLTIQDYRAILNDIDNVYNEIKVNITDNLVRDFLNQWLIESKETKDEIMAIDKALYHAVNAFEEVKVPKSRTQPPIVQPLVELQPITKTDRTIMDTIDGEIKTLNKGHKVSREVEMWENDWAGVGETDAKIVNYLLPLIEGGLKKKPEEIPKYLWDQAKQYFNERQHLKEPRQPYQRELEPTYEEEFEGNPTYEDEFGSEEESARPMSTEQISYAQKTRKPKLFSQELINREFNLSPPSEEEEEQPIIRTRRYTHSLPPSHRIRPIYESSSGKEHVVQPRGLTESQIHQRNMQFRNEEEPISMSNKSIDEGIAKEFAELTLSGKKPSDSIMDYLNTSPQEEEMFKPKRRGRPALKEEEIPFLPELKQQAKEAKEEFDNSDKTYADVDEYLNKIEDIIIATQQKAPSARGEPKRLVEFRTKLENLEKVIKNRPNIR